MNLELGRSVGSTEVSPFIGSREQVDETKSACSFSFNLILGGLAKRGPLTLSFSSSRVVFAISDRRTLQPKSCRSRQMLGDQEPCTADRGCRIVSVEIVVLLVNL